MRIWVAAMFPSWREWREDGIRGEKSLSKVSVDLCVLMLIQDEQHMSVFVQNEGPTGGLSKLGANYNQRNRKLTKQAILSSLNDDADDFLAPEADTYNQYIMSSPKTSLAVNEGRIQPQFQLHSA